nr:uncharacterized protein LOC111994154 [Quercus suber]
MNPTEVKLIPQLPDIIDFQRDPESYGNLPPPIRGTDLKPNFTLEHFLDRLRNLELNLWEVSEGRVIGFNNVGGKIFIDLGKILISFYQEGEFCGDILNRVRIVENENVCYPYPTVRNTDPMSLSAGIKIDMMHFRRIVAKVIEASFPEPQEFSNTVKLFFSEIFYQHSDFHILQLLHPLFYNTIERINFVQLIDEYMQEFEYAEVGLAGLSNSDYGIGDWWTWIPPTSIYQDVLHFENNFEALYLGKHHNLILFLSNCYRYNSRGASMLHQLFPDVCAVVIDAIVRADHMSFIDDPKQYTLMEYFLRSSFAFVIMPYRYPGVHSKGLED